MAIGRDRWTVSDAEDWGRVLGLVPVPLFGPERVAAPAQGSVLLDGRRSSFTFLVADDARDLLGEKPLEWSWSAFLNHTVIADPSKDLLLLRRWDAPDSVRRFRLPTTPRAAAQLFDVIRSDGPVTHTDIILHLLRAFRAIRDIVRDSQNGFESLRVFNALITAAKAVADGRIDRDELSDLSDIGSVIARLEDLPEAYTTLLTTGGGTELSRPSRAVASQFLVSRFLDVEPEFQYPSKPTS